MTELFSSTRFFTPPSLLGMWLVLLVAVSACSPPEVEKPTSVLRPNIVTTIKAYGEYFSSEIIKIDGSAVIWESSWGGQVVVRQKLFQNIFPISINDEEASVYNEFDGAKLEELFPLKLGNEIVFEGLQYNSNTEGAVPFWAIVSVDGVKTIDVEGESYETLVINIVIETEAANTRNTSITTIWHANRIGVNLRSKHQNIIGGNPNQVIKFEVVNIDFPDQLREEGKNVGTTRINYMKPSSNCAASDIFDGSQGGSQTSLTMALCTPSTPSAT